MTLALRQAGIIAAALFLASSAFGQAVTFNHDIAPIAFARCAQCHRPGMSAPFSLQTYDDFRKRAPQIVDVTSRRYMPPWLPAPDRGEFANVRRLSDHEIDLIAQWVRDGMSEGNPADLPPKPKWPEGWQIGQPQLTVSLPEPFVLQAEGRDVFRNLVIPVPLDSPRWVRAVELHASNPKLVHHAVMQVDRTRGCRRLDDQEPGMGFGGMSMGPSRPPGGHFIGWSPGRVAWQAPDDMAWRLEPGMDLLVQVHMLPSGKPEPLMLTLGFIFTDTPPAREPFNLMLAGTTIDIPAGQKDYVVQQSYVLPIDVQATSLYPHAHYLGKDMQAWAMTPDGQRVWLLHIPDWDFSWQDSFDFASPVPLPHGSTVWMRYTYDNSSDNPRNPNQPPRRVTQGLRSSDEMASLALQVVPRNPAELSALQRDYGLQVTQHEATALEQSLAVSPGNAANLASLAERYMKLGRAQDAAGRFEDSLRLAPDNDAARLGLAEALGQLGRHDESLKQALQVLSHNPKNVDALVCQGNAQINLGQRDAAIATLRAAVQLAPDHPLAQLNLGAALLAGGDQAAAAEHFRAAIHANPSALQAYFSVAASLLNRGQIDPAIASFRDILSINPDLAEAHMLLASALAYQQHTDEAITHVRHVLRLRPDFAEAYTQLGLLLAVNHQSGQAIEPLTKAVQLQPDSPLAANALAWILATHPDAARRNGPRAVELASKAVQLTNRQEAVCLDTLAAAQAEVGQFADALKTAEEALKVATATPSQEPALADVQNHLAFYRRNQPIRDDSAEQPAPKSPGK